MAKLVRDHIPSILRQQGFSCSHRTLDDDGEYHHELKRKLVEEAQEALLAATPAELVEEMADLLEVFYALASSMGISAAEIEERRANKREVRGGFSLRVYLDFVESKEDLR